MNTTLLTDKGFIQTQREGFRERQGLLDNRQNILDIHVLLLHDVHNKSLNIHKVIEQYSSFGTRKITLARSDGREFDRETKRGFPQIQFLHTLEKEPSNKEGNAAMADLINLAFRQIKAERIFVSWTDINPYGMSIQALKKNLPACMLCTVPVIEDETHNLLPSTYRPAFSFGNLQVTKNEDNPMYPYTFFPHEYIGIYNRMNFLRLGGFSARFRESQLQLYDFGVRAYKSNFSIRLSSYYRVQKRTNKRDSLVPKNKLQSSSICLRESIGNVFINLIVCLFLDFKQVLRFPVALFLNRKKKHVNFRKIVSKFWPYS